MTQTDLDAKNREEAIKNYMAKQAVLASYEKEKRIHLLGTLKRERDRIDAQIKELEAIDKTIEDKKTKVEGTKDMNTGAGTPPPEKTETRWQQMQRKKAEKEAANNKETDLAAKITGVTSGMSGDEVISTEPSVDES